MVTEARREQDKMTALHLAAARGHLPVVELLTRAPGVDVNSKGGVRARSVRAAKAAAVCVVLVFELICVHACARAVCAIARENAAQLSRVMWACALVRCGARDGHGGGHRANGLRYTSLQRAGTCSSLTRCCVHSVST